MESPWAVRPISIHVSTTRPPGWIKQTGQAWVSPSQEPGIKGGGIPLKKTRKNGLDPGGEKQHVYCLHSLDYELVEGRDCCPNFSLYFQSPSWHKAGSQGP